jgi:hypothetical protein
MHAVCPPFCHRCPDCDGDVMPHCYGTINSVVGDFDECCCRNMECSVCGAPAEERCGWPAEVQRSKRISEARVGDVWITQKHGKRARIAEIEALPQQPGVMRAVRILLAIPGHKNAYPYHRFVDDDFTTVTEGACGNPACEKHIRDLDGAFICSEHWAEQLAAVGRAA